MLTERTEILGGAITRSLAGAFVLVSIVLVAVVQVGTTQVRAEDACLGSTSEDSCVDFYCSARYAGYRCLTAVGGRCVCAG